MRVYPNAALSRIDLRHLRYFIAVAEAGSISAAAQQLHLSQPPLSVQIKELESTLGAQLMVRHRHGITLTEAGKAMLEEARSVLQHTGRAVEHVQQLGRGELGEVRIGILSSVMWSDFPKLLDKFRERFPHVRWSLVELNPNDQAEALRDHRIDVGLWHSDGAAVAGFRQQRLLRDKVMAVLPSTHALARRRKVSFAQLSQLPYLTLDTRRSTVASDLIDAMRLRGYPPRIAHVAREPITLLGLVAHNVGFTLLGDSLSRISWPGLVFRPVAEKLPAMDLYLHVRDQALAPAVARFVEVMPSIAAGVE